MLISILLGLLPLINAFSNGPPCQAYRTMSPDTSAHGPPQPRDPRISDPLIRIQVFRKNDTTETDALYYKPCVKYTVRVTDTSQPGDNVPQGILGFMVQARVDSSNLPFGVFVEEDNWAERDQQYRYIQCDGGSQPDTVVHSGAYPRRRLEFTFVPTADAGNVDIRATIVRRRNLYWVNLRDQKAFLQIDPAARGATECSVDGILYGGRACADDAIKTCPFFARDPTFCSFHAEARELCKRSCCDWQPKGK